MNKYNNMYYYNKWKDCYTVEEYVLIKDSIAAFPDLAVKSPNDSPLYK